MQRNDSDERKQREKDDTYLLFMLEVNISKMLVDKRDKIAGSHKLSQHG